jgi:hypothetical protein
VEQLGNISINGGTGSRDLVDGVFMLLAVQNNNHGRVDDIVGTHVIDAYSVRRGDELVLLAKKVTLMDKRCRDRLRHRNDSVRVTRVVLGLLESVIASFVEIDKGKIQTVASPNFALSEGGKLETNAFELLRDRLHVDCVFYI